MNHVAIFLATCAYAGFVPAIPGVVAALLGLFLIRTVLGRLWTRSWRLGLLTITAAFLLGCWASGRAELIFGQRDSDYIVIDELLGMVATMYLNPLDWLSLWFGFATFEVLDTIKPFPADVIHRSLSGGTGVMLDDLVAGIYANIALRLMARIRGSWRRRIGA